MKTVIDLHEGEGSAYSEPFTLPDGAIYLDGDDNVVLQLHELELHMRFPQILALQEAINAWIFRGALGEEDLNGERLPIEEHERLRNLVRALLDGKIGTAEVPDGLKVEIKLALSERKIFWEKWRSIQEEMFEKDRQITALNEQIYGLQRQLERRRRVPPLPPPPSKPMKDKP